MFNFFKKKTESPTQERQPEKQIQEIKPVSKKPKTYFEKSIENANKGNVLAAAHVGVSYHYGIEVGEEEHPQGLEPNPELAVKYLKMAANKGYLKAERDLGLIYVSSDSPVFDMDEALKWITLTAKKGDAFSQYVIGHYYSTGDYLPQDDEKAYHWLLESSYNGCETAMFELGKIYYERTNSILNQDGLTDEHRKEAKEYASLAVKWFEKASDLGEEQAYFYTAVCYFAGYGVDKDDERSLYYLNLAIENGDEAAIDFKNQYYAQEDL